MTDREAADFGPLAPIVAGIRQAIADCADVLGPPCECQECDGWGWIPSRGEVCRCPICVGEGWVGAFADHPPIVPIEELPL